MLVIHQVIVLLFLTTFTYALQLVVPPGGVKCICESLPAGSNVTFCTSASVPLQIYALDSDHRTVARDGNNENVLGLINVSVPRYGVRRRRYLELEYTFCMRAHRQACVDFDVIIHRHEMFVLNKFISGIDFHRKAESSIFSSADCTAVSLVRASLLSAGYSYYASSYRL